ncbi:unnamed protein product [Peniophora sp. CBMAI 1063]|nr:unnamed protein product [Peniophora sp. CBMAI 1063]
MTRPINTSAAASSAAPAPPTTIIPASHTFSSPVEKLKYLRRKMEEQQANPGFAPTMRTIALYKIILQAPESWDAPGGLGGTLFRRSKITTMPNWMEGDPAEFLSRPPHHMDTADILSKIVENLVDCGWDWTNHEDTRKAVVMRLRALQKTELPLYIRRWEEEVHQVHIEVMENEPLPKHPRL